jgi:hypothetical protein
MQRSLDAFEQLVLAQRLLDEIESSRLHRRRNRQRNGAMAGDASPSNSTRCFRAN